MSEWTENFENEIKIQIEGVKRLDTGYINVRLLNNTAKKVDEYAPNCDTCKQLKSDYNELLPELVKRVKDNDFRNKYEQKLIEVSKHLESKHHIKPKKYYASLYTFIGILIGTALSYGITYFLYPNLILIGLLYGTFTGFLIGRIIGLLKDKKLTRLGLNI